MLSSLARRAAPLALRAQTANRVLAVRLASSDSKGLVVSSDTNEKTVEDVIEQWEYGNSVFYGPERDYKNFPPTKMLEESPRTRLNIFPDSWFQAFYPKTGVSGPYVLTLGLSVYLFSKEVVVFDAEFGEIMLFFGAMYAARHKFGDKINASLKRGRETFMENNYVIPKARLTQGFEQAIQDCEEAIWFQHGQKYLFDTKKENVELMLETEYRKRLQNVYAQVKRKLDYQLEQENTQRQFQQDHMSDWIINSVRKSITPQQEKESISACIQTLKALSTKSATA